MTSETLVAGSRDETPAGEALRAEYSRRIALWDRAVADGERRHHLISNLRLVVATVIVAGIYLVFGRTAAPAIVFFAPVAVFLALMVWHALVLQSTDRAARARRLYTRGLERIDGKWPGTGPDGARFGAGHPYAGDLDLFGAGSLFQLLSTARTEAGEETLADWLRGPASVAEVRARQEAIRELRPRLDFRESLAVLAAEAQVGRTSGLAAWARLGAMGLPLYAGVLFAVLSAGTALSIALALADRLPGQVPLLWIVLQALLVARWRATVGEVIHRIDEPSVDIRLLAALFELIEVETFSSPRLAAMHARLVVDGFKPSARMHQLRRRLALLDSMHNPLFAPFGALLLVRAQSAVWVDRWHAENGARLVEWIAAVGELEALSSLAAFAYERPELPFPAVIAGGPLFDGAGVAHPLIVGHEAVANDVRLGGDGPQVLLVSGSNMSGKSTLLRAVGCNVVLALAGAPVFARALTLSPLALGATLRVEDSLQAGISRFYAEILRIRAVIDAGRGTLPLLFLLDEILHGTNSHDRRIGADAIVRSLVGMGAIGLVTTHDLALTELPKTLGARAANVHFEDHLEKGRMVFDYRMRPGVVEHSNALELMRAVGLDV